MRRRLCIVLVLLMQMMRLRVGGGDIVGIRLAEGFTRHSC